MMRTLLAHLCGAALYALLFALAPALAYAQSTLLGSALTISASPSYPAPNSVVQLTAESPLLDLQGSDIEWTVNGAPAGSGDSINVKLGALGKETDVAVSVSGTSGSDTAQLSIVPTSVDLLWEADSYVPPFYLGRASAGSGSTIRLFAIPHFVSGASEVTPGSLLYTWKLNGAVLKAQSGVGQSSAVVPAAVLYDSDLVTVDVSDPGNELAGEASVSIRTGDPQLLLYPDSPLFGIMFHQPLSATSNAPEAEATFAALPYFADAVSPNDTSLTYQWSVDGASVAADPQDPSEISIDAKSEGTAQVNLSLSKGADPFFSASGAWQISFSSGASSGSGSSNIFH